MLQAVIATTRRAAWRDSARGLGAADLAMHIVLPELDGRILAGAVAFKASAAAARGARLHARSPTVPSRTAIALVADRIAALRALAAARAAPRAPDRGR